MTLMVWIMALVMTLVMLKPTMQILMGYSITWVTQRVVMAGKLQNSDLKKLVMILGVSHFQMMK